MISAMPRPRSERQAWQQERVEIPALIAALRRELAATPAADTENRERLTWRIRRAEKRMAELDARLAREDPARS
jgi:hypothetical protein